MNTDAVLNWFDTARAAVGAAKEAEAKVDTARARLQTIDAEIAAATATLEKKQRDVKFFDSLIAQRKDEAADAKRQLDEVEAAVKAAEHRLRDARLQTVTLGQEVA